MKHITCIMVILVLTACHDNGPGNSTEALNDELHAIYRLDQRYREELSKLSPTNIQIIGLWEKQNLLDSCNLIRVSTILNSIGFPHKPVFDDSACLATFLVIQHATLSQQEKYLPLFEKAAERHEIESSFLAKMIDRIHVGKGQKQIYGTQAIPVKDPQTGYLTDKYELAPIEDEENVNQRRLKMGLPNIQAGAKELGVDYPRKAKNETRDK